MKQIINGVELTLNSDILEVIRTLQVHRDVTDLYLRVIDDITRTIILDIDAPEPDDELTMSRLRGIQSIRRDIVTLAGMKDDNVIGR